MDNGSDFHSWRIIVKGYGLTTASLISHLICEKGVDPKQITVFEDKDSIGGCWVDANTHSETFAPVLGVKEIVYPPYERIQKVVKGDPLNRENAIYNLNAIWKELGFQLVLGTQVLSDDPANKTMTVRTPEGKVETHSYTWLISPQYRNMNSYKRTLSLGDGIRNVDLSRYRCFKFAGNSMNTAETMRYIISHTRPGQDFSLKIYYRNPHPISPRSAGMIAKPGLPILYTAPMNNRIASHFFRKITNKNMLDYIGSARREFGKAGHVGIKFLSGDFFFHPEISKRLEFIRFSGDIDEIPVAPDELLIDTRNELKQGEDVSFPADHLKIDMGHVLHPLARTYVVPKYNYIFKGLGEAVWARMTAASSGRSKDKYFRITERNIQDGKLGSCFWNYCHEVQAELVPFAYLFFPIDNPRKYRLWLAVFSFLQVTGLIAFFIDIDRIDHDSSIVDESEGAFFKLKREWEEIDLRFGATTPYPVSYREFQQARDSVKCSLIDIKRDIRFYRTVRRIYIAALGMAALALLALGISKRI